MSLYIGVQSSSWKISAEGHIAVGTVVRDHLHAVYAERYEAATQETETSTEYTQETDSSTGCPGYHIILRHSPEGGGENYNSMHRFLPGGDVRLTMRTDNVDGSVTEDITCHGWRCDHLGMEYEVYNTYNTVPGGEIYLLAPPVGWEWERGRPVLAAPCCREYNL